MAKITSKDLWIGDTVILIKSNRIGRFEGFDPAKKALVRINDKIVKTTLENLSLHIPNKDYSDIDHLISPKKNLPAKTTWTQKFKVPKSIDLHIDKLAPHLQNEHPSRIITYQIEQCQSYIDRAHAAKLNIVTIIHGKGEGVLREAVRTMIRSDQRIGFSVPSNQDGATEIWFKNV